MTKQKEVRMNFLELPDFNDGENITIRIGERWYNKVEPGDTVLIYKTEDDPAEDPIAKGLVTAKVFKPFLDITVGELKHICCRGISSDGLLAWSLLECYPNEFNLDSNVTLISFRLLDEEGG